MPLNNPNAPNIGGGRGGLNKLSTSVIGAKAVRAVSIKPEMFSYRTFTRIQSAEPFNLISSFSDIKFKTNATTMDVLCGSTYVTLKAEHASVGVLVNGIYSQQILFNVQNDVSIHTIALPAGNKEVTLRIGSSNSNYGSTVKGQYIGGVTVPVGSSISPIAPNNGAKRVVFLGDSKTVDFGGTIPEIKSYISILRQDTRVSSYTFASYGWAGNSSSVTYGSTTTRAQTIAELVAYFAGATEKICWHELSYNDFVKNYYNPANFTAIVQAFLTDLYAADPAIKVILQTPQIRGAEGATNSFGNVLQDYRVAVNNAAVGMLNVVAVVDGLQMLNADDLVDGVHEGDFGNQKDAEFIARYILGLPQMVPITASAQYFLSDPTLTGNIKIPANAANSIITKNDFMVCFVTKRQRLSALDYLVTFGFAGGATAINWSSSNSFVTQIISAPAGSSLPVLGGAYESDLTRWHHWSVIFSGLNVAIYQDTFPVAQRTFLTRQSSTQTQIAFGALYTAATTGSFSKVAIARARFYGKIGKVYSRADVIADYNASVISDYSDVFAAYDFNGNANDLSGNGNNGIIGSTASFPLS